MRKFAVGFSIGIIIGLAWLYFRQPRRVVIGPPDGCLFASSWVETFGGMSEGG